MPVQYTGTVLSPKHWQMSPVGLRIVLFPVVSDTEHEFKYLAFRSRLSVCLADFFGVILSLFTVLKCIPHICVWGTIVLLSSLDLLHTRNRLPPHICRSSFVFYPVVHRITYFIVFLCSTCAVNQSNSVGSLISTCGRQLGFNMYT
jgi:hypothetical protein